MAVWIGALAIWVACGLPATSQELAGAELVEALRLGGYNIYFRHAETDWGQNDNVNDFGD